MTAAGLNTFYILVGQAGIVGSNNQYPLGTIQWQQPSKSKTPSYIYTNFGGGATTDYGGWGGGASAIALGPPGLSLTGITFWTNPQLTLLAVAGLLLLVILFTKTRWRRRWWL